MVKGRETHDNGELVHITKSATGRGTISRRGFCETKEDCQEKWVPMCALCAGCSGRCHVECKTINTLECLSWSPRSRIAIKLGTARLLCNLQQTEHQLTSYSSQEAQDRATICPLALVLSVTSSQLPASVFAADIHRTPVTAPPNHATLTPSSVLAFRHHLGTSTPHSAFFGV